MPVFFYFFSGDESEPSDQDLTSILFSSSSGQLRPPDTPGRPSPRHGTVGSHQSSTAAATRPYCVRRGLLLPLPLSPSLSSQTPATTAAQRPAPPWPGCLHRRGPAAARLHPHCLASLPPDTIPLLYPPNLEMKEGERLEREAAATVIFVSGGVRARAGVGAGWQG